MAKDLIQGFRGMFWGLVVGDCLGSPIQFMNMDEHPFITEILPCEIFNAPAGYWTDDASMAFCIAESFIRLKKYKLEDIANNFVRWFDEGFFSSLPQAFDIGNATREAVYGIKFAGKLKNGQEETQGNGSIMRLAPCIIMNYGCADNKLLHEISDLTHNSAKVRETVDLLAKVLNDHLQGNKTSIKSIYKKRNEVNNSGWAVSTLQAALWAFENSDSFENALINAVNLAGDADTIGAVCGQIAGALYGYEAIPERWLERIKDRQKIDELIDELIKLKLGNSF